MGVLKDTLGNVERVVNQCETVRGGDGITLATKVIGDALSRLEDAIGNLVAVTGLFVCPETPTAPTSLPQCCDAGVGREPSSVRSDLYTLANRVHVARGIVDDLASRFDA